MVGRVAPADGDAHASATSGRKRPWWPGLALVGLAGAGVALSQRLDWNGTCHVHGNAKFAVHLANRGAECWLFRVAAGDDGDEYLLRPRQRAQILLGAPDVAMLRITAQRVLTDGPDCIERVIQWQAVPGENLFVSLDERGTESRSVEAAWQGPPRCGIKFTSRTDAPVLLFSRHGRLVDGFRQPIWLRTHSVNGHGHGQLHHESASPGEQARLAYRVTTLAKPTVVDLEAGDGSAHEAAVEADGTLRVGDLSLRTRLGY
jgi:hypothetical protein